MTKDRIIYLLDQLAADAGSESERKELFELADRLGSDETLQAIVTGLVKDTDPVYPSEQVRQAMLAKIFGEPIVADTKVRPLFKRLAVAASIIFLLGLGSYFLFFNKTDQQTGIVDSGQKSQDVDPGKYKARLILSDGTIIILDSLVTGELAKQGGTVVRNKDGQLVYDGPAKADEEVLYNTLTTSRGETYATVLADGSKVWLNSASSIKYPVAFNGNERRVEITGEAYFEVAHNKSKPFHVTVNGMDIRVLGTHFNVNSYADEDAMKTTLLEGSIYVSMVNGPSSMVKPGEQARVKASGELSVVKGVDTEQVMAWKNGVFQFSDASLQEVMRQLQRWYDVEIVYEGKIPERIFEGKISRKSTLAQVLKILQESGIHFEINKKQLIVKP